MRPKLSFLSLLLLDEHKTVPYVGVKTIWNKDFNTKSGNDAKS